LQALVRLLLRARDVGGDGPRVARCLRADRRAELRRAADPRLRDLALLALRLGRVLPGRAGAQVGAQDPYAPGLALALSVSVSISVLVAAHGLHTFSILAPERSLPCHRIEQPSRFRPAMSS